MCEKFNDFIYYSKKILYNNPKPKLDEIRKELKDFLWFLKNEYENFEKKHQNNQFLEIKKEKNSFPRKNSGVQEQKNRNQQRITCEKPENQGFWKLVSVFFKELPPMVTFDYFLPEKLKIINSNSEFKEDWTCSYHDYFINPKKIKKKCSINCSGRNHLLNFAISSLLLNPSFAIACCIA